MPSKPKATIKPETATPTHWLPFGFYLVANACIFLLLRPSVHAADFFSWKVIRAPFVDVKEEGEHEEEIPKPKGLRNTLGTLLYCPSCVGVWVATFFVYGYVYFPKEAWVIAAIFSLSAGERIVGTIMDYLKARSEQ